MTFPLPYRAREDKRKWDTDHLSRWADGMPLHALNGTMSPRAMQRAKRLVAAAERAAEGQCVLKPGPGEGTAGCMQWLRPCKLERAGETVAYFHHPVRPPHNMDCGPTRWPESPRIAMRCAPRSSKWP